MNAQQIVFISVEKEEGAATAHHQLQNTSPTVYIEYNEK